MTSIIKADRVQSTSNGFVLPPAGGVIQTQYTQFTGTNTASGSAGANVVVSDLTVNITPISTSSIIRIDAMVNGEWSNQNSATDSVWFFFRDSTKLSHSAAGSRNVGVMMGTSITYHAVDNASTPEHATYSYFDTPSSTSQITYKVGFVSANGYTWYLNKTVTDSDTVNYERGTSFISVTEIAG
tara:strand:+ start:2080 stop:2631 length:552 start_codon:yes stop_codon:yes gene_type:complete